MGLFSIFSKNKGESTAQDSGRFSRDDDFGAQARSKRATHANEAGQGGSRRSRSGGDPMLPEKKRARRRLVGAIALALAAAVGLPMLLDSEPRDLTRDVAIQIPAQDKVPPLPVPSTPVPAADSVDQGEEIIAAPPAATPATPAAAPTPPKRFELAPEKSPDGLRTEPEIKMARPDPKPAEHKSEPRAPERKADKPVEKPVPKKLDEKPVAPRTRDQEAARALALLEGKSAAKPAERHERADKLEAKPAEAAKPDAAQRFVVQVAALASQDKVAELQARLKAAGVAAHTHKSRDLIRVQVGPFASREEAEKARAKLGAQGFSGFLVAL